MGGEDFRTKPLHDNSYTYYIFDNLRCNQDHEGGNVFRYDTVEQAIAVFQHVQATQGEWTIALGGSFNNMQEVDFIQRRNGDNCLITDYQKMAAFKDSPEVQKAIETAMVALRVDWQVDHELTGHSILVPHEFDQPPMENYLAGKRLRPSEPQNALASIQEMYVQGEGWVSLQELQQLATFSYEEKPEPPKVTSFNVSYESSNPDRHLSGYVDIAPSDFRLMKGQYQEFMQEQETLKAKTMEGRDTREGPSNGTAQDSWRNMISKAKEQAAAKNIERPEKQHAKSHDLEH